MKTKTKTQQNKNTIRYALTGPWLLLWLICEIYLLNLKIKSTYKSVCVYMYICIYSCILLYMYTMKKNVSI